MNGPTDFLIRGIRTSTLGGPLRRIRFATTASEDLPTAEAPGGAVLAVDGLGARGVPPTRFTG